MLTGFILIWCFFAEATLRCWCDTCRVVSLSLSLSQLLAGLFLPLLVKCSVDDDQKIRKQTTTNNQLFSWVYVRKI